MGRLRLSDHSLRRQGDFDRVFAAGRRRRLALLTVISLPREQGAVVSRAAYAVSRKVSKLAVHRNRLRRRLREAFRALSSGFVVPHDVVVIAQRRALTATAAELKSALAEALALAGGARAREREKDDG